ncbi:N-acetylmuramoyl-L-alanine amidase, partial [uncultured Clostridium sp.]|uniref:N-acetylmuramoyl-L-alanine amidase n=1 Tax=uncultured Clostridium sp. TaxID=59620 RepID=UPI00261A93E6
IIGKDGSKTTTQRVIKVVKKETKIAIDTPTTNQAINGDNLVVRGWALNASGVKEIKMYLDNVYKGQAKLGGKRPDVNNAYPGYPNGINSGYEGNIDLKSVTSGNRTLKLEIIGKDGSKTTTQRVIKVVKPPTRISIDSPYNNQSINGSSLVIKGWALNPSGVKQIKVYIDGAYKGQAKLGGKRPDVNNTYPGYPNGINSGYEFKVGLKDYYGGNKKITLEVYGNDGSIDKFERGFYLNKLNVVDLGFEFDFGLTGPSPNNPNKIILHHAAGNATAASVHNFHKYTNGWSGIGYHFYIHKDGTIYKGRDESWRGAHAADVSSTPGYNDGNPLNDTNATSIGIAVQGNYHPESHISVDTKMPKAQEDAIVKVGHYLIEKYGNMEIFKHGSPGIGHTSCPGNYYPFDRIKARVLSKYIYGVYNTEI